MKNKLKILTTILTISALSLTSAYANPTITILDNALKNPDNILRFFISKNSI